MAGSGIHALVFSKNVEKARAFFSSVLEWPSVDAGNGRLIYAAPPTELAVHEADDADGHELYLICDDIHATIASLQARGVPCSAVADRGWGLVTSVTIADGEEIGLYEPRHARRRE